MSASLFVALALIFVAPVPRATTFGNWDVACDNIRHCEAIALPSDDDSNSEWTLHVTRGAGIGDQPKVEIAPAFEDPKAVKLIVDGHTSEFRFDGNGDFKGEVLPLLASIASARNVSIVDKKGKICGHIPVSGASAALRWMDDRQKRAGTVTAIVARGPRPATEVPLPPVLPEIEQPPVSTKPPRKPSAADLRQIRRTGDCESDLNETATYRLDSQHTVAIIGCVMGAYQGSSLVVVIDEHGRWTPAPIEQPELLPKGADPYDSYFLTEADYSQKDRLLMMSAKGRGLADCGESASWVWDGKMFRLASYHALNDCRGAPPGTWLSRWQTANDPLKKD